MGRSVRGGDSAAHSSLMLCSFTLVLTITKKHWCLPAAPGRERTRQSARSGPPYLTDALFGLLLSFGGPCGARTGSQALSPAACYVHNVLVLNARESSAGTASSYFALLCVRRV